MSIFTAVMTGKGAGAISTVQVFGKDCEGLVARIFKPAGTKPAKFNANEILLGAITDGDRTIDQVTIGCETQDTFAIHCHGNPLVVEMIMQLLDRCGVTLLTAEQLLAKIFTSAEPASTIAVEAKLAQLRAETIQGTKIIANQIDAGLGEEARNWLANIDETSLAEIRAEAAKILQGSQVAKLIIYGCTAVLTGPPNSGKSTLLNRLAGRQKAIVTDIKGTTRDWVEATCKIGPLCLRLIDTAGLDEELPNCQDNINEAARKKTIEILEQADLILLVLDSSRPADEYDDRLSRRIGDKRVVTVLNKSDLPAKFDVNELPQTLSNTVRIGATEGAGIEDLKEEIQRILGTPDFDLHQAVCFTDRQENLLRELQKVKSKLQAASIITELLKGRLRV
ncbi:MAG: GTPase [Planctomycetota bacterium]